MSPPSFVVTVPYYAGEQYLRATLESVVAQTDPGWCCIVVDDSPDASAMAVVHSLADDRVTLVRNESRLGVAGNFNRCCEVGTASGAPVGMILHADDLLEPTYVAVMRAAHERHPRSPAIAPRVSVIDADGMSCMPLPDRVKAWLWPRRLDRLEGDRGLQLLLRGQFFYCPAVSYRWALLPVAPWDPRWQQVMDLVLYGRLLLQGAPIELEDQRVFRYRRHSSSETQRNSASLSRTREEVDACRELAEAATAIGWRRAARAGRRRLAVRLQCGLQLVKALGRGQLGTARRAVGLALRR